MIEFFPTKLKGVSIIKFNTYRDLRGTFTEIYNKDIFDKGLKKIKFIQDDISISKKNVLRGVHGDKKTWKVVSCLYGKLYLLVVNNDRKSSQYKKWFSTILDDKNKNMLLIPPNFGNGHYVISKKAIFYYKQSTYYNRESQFTINWKDPEYKFKWPCKNPILSKRDK